MSEVRDGKKDVRGEGRLLILRGCGLLAIAASLGCMHAGSRPQFTYLSSGEITEFKRLERYPQRDFIHHFSRTAYREHDEKAKSAGPDFETIIEQWGPPDYVRKPFQSLEGDRVEEWIYLDEQRLFQFVANELVYDGPVTEFELLFLRLGYPNRVFTTIGDSGIVRSVLFYRTIFMPWRMETYSLANGWIVHADEGN